MRDGGQEEIDSSVRFHPFAKKARANIDFHRAKFSRRIFRRTILFLGNDSPSVDERRRRWPRSRCPLDQPNATCCCRAKWCPVSRRTWKYYRCQDARHQQCLARNRRSAERDCGCYLDFEGSKLSFSLSYLPPRMTSMTPEFGLRDALILKEIRF